MGERRAQRTLTLATSWPRARERDLAWANRASFAGLRNVNGYDPMVPASRRAVLDGMGSDGTIPRHLLETDPGRLELLGVRWVQVPTEALVVPADGDGLGEALDVVLQPPRPHLFALPITRATEVRVVSFLTGAVEVEQGRVVAECVARLASGREIWLPIRAGIETAEWAWERPDVRPRRPPRDGLRARELPRARGLHGPPVPRRAAPAGPLRGQLPALPGLARRPAALAPARGAARRRDRPRSRPLRGLGLRERRGAARGGGGHAAREPLRGAAGNRAGVGGRVAPAAARRGTPPRRAALAHPPGGGRAARGARDRGGRARRRAPAGQPLLARRPRARGRRPDRRARRRARPARARARDTTPASRRGWTAGRPRSCA